jgi:hypothetical protein
VYEKPHPASLLAMIPIVAMWIVASDDFVHFIDKLALRTEVVPPDIPAARHGAHAFDAPRRV